MMNRQFKKLVVCLFVLVFPITSLSASAQLQPRFSPWLLMGDRSRNTSGLDNYNRLVKPQQDQLRSYANQANQLQMQQQALQTLQSGGLSSGGGSLGARDLEALAGGLVNGGAAPSGGNMLLSAPREIPSSQNPATFNQYLHYYPAGGLPRQTVPNFSSSGGR